MTFLIEFENSSRPNMLDLSLMGHYMKKLRHIPTALEIILVQRYSVWGHTAH